MKLRFSSYAPREQKLQFFIDASRDEENNKTKLENALATRQKYFRGYFECPDDYTGAYKVSGCDMAVFLTATKNNFLAEYTNITQNDWEAFVTSINNVKSQKFDSKKIPANLNALPTAVIRKLAETLDPLTLAHVNRGVDRKYKRTFYITIPLHAPRLTTHLLLLSTFT